MINKFFAVTLLAFLLLLGTPVPSGASQSDATPQPDDTAWAESTLPTVLDVAGSDWVMDRAPANPKLDQALASLISAPDLRTAETSGLRLESGRVQTQLVSRPEDEAVVRALVGDVRGEVTGYYEGVLQAWLPTDQLAALAADPLIEFIRTPDTLQFEDDAAVAAVTEGVAAANAAAWHSAAWRGKGVRIAIIDGGFQGYSTKLGTDLPATVTVRNFVDNQSQAEVDGATRHGTACAEIVHDMAPLAELYLLKISTDVDLNEAVNYAISQNVDIISTSLTFINVTPGDGTGRFAEMARNARDAGILWVTAAGNYRETHWSGAFTDADGDGLHEYASGVEANVFGPGNNTAFLIPAGTVLTPSIRWSDWTAKDQDYRLLLLRHNGSAFEIVASANNPQTGLPGQRPTERIIYITSGPSAIYAVAIQRVSGNRAVHLHLLTPNRDLDRRVPAMSLGNLADARAVLTVAAVNAISPFLREEYSSEGPTNGPGGAPTGGFLKPDLAAFANVSTASYGFRAFNGTSAATPHVAGAAALILQAYPTALPGEIQDYLQSAAINQGLPGPDPQFGYGRLWLNAPPGPWDYPYHSFTPAVATPP